MTRTFQYQFSALILDEKGRAREKSTEVRVVCVLTSAAHAHARVPVGPHAGHGAGHARVCGVHCLCLRRDELL